MNSRQNSLSADWSTILSTLFPRSAGVWPHSIVNTVVDVALNYTSLTGFGYLSQFKCVFGQFLLCDEKGCTGTKRKALNATFAVSLSTCVLMGTRRVTLWLSSSVRLLWKFSIAFHGQENVLNWTKSLRQAKSFSHSLSICLKPLSSYLQLLNTTELGIKA